MTDGSGRPVVVIGDANADLHIHLRADRQQPAPPTLLLGGTAANTARALRHLDLAVALVGSVGNDGYGRAVRQQMADLGIDLGALRVDDEAPTTLVLAIVDPQGERTLIGWPRRGGAHTRLAAPGIDPGLIARAAWVHTTGICLVEAPVRDAILQSLQLARRAGVPASLDLNLRLGLEEGQLPGAYRETLLRAAELVDVILGSAADEFPYLDPAGDAMAAVRRLAATGRTVVARFGAAGARSDGPEGEWSAPACAVPVVSTVGAGDAFNAGYIAAAIDGRPPVERLRWGNAVAALTISARGDMPAISAAALRDLLGR